MAARCRGGGFALVDFAQALNVRTIPQKWVRKYLNELSLEHLENIRSAVGYIPGDHGQETSTELLERVRAGSVCMFLLHHDQKPVAACFFEVQTFRNGARNLHVCSFVALPGCPANIASGGFQALETVARQFKASSLSLETSRPGMLEAASRSGWEATSVVCRKLLK